MNLTASKFFGILDLLRGYGEPVDQLLPVAGALYQAASEIYALPVTKVAENASLTAFWQAQTETQGLRLAAHQMAAVTLHDALAGTLLQKARALVQEHWTENPSEDSYLELGEALTDLIDQLASHAGRTGLSLQPTPASLASLNAELLSVQEGMRILDPAVGVARGFVAIVQDMRKRGLDPQTVQFDGQEVSAQAAAVAQLHLLLNGITTATLWWGNTILNPQFPMAAYDRVMADPPFGMRLEHLNLPHTDPRFHDIDIARFKNRSEWLFILSALAALKPEGEAVVTAPQGLLFRGGVEEELRQVLARRGALEAVVSLPSALYAFTAIPISLLKFRRVATGQLPPQKVRLVDASRDAVREGRLQTLIPEARQAIRQTLENTDTVQQRAVTVDTDTLVKNGSWLPTTYIPTPKAEIALPDDYEQQLQSAQARLEQAGRNVEAALAHLARFECA